MNLRKRPWILTPILAFPLAAGCGEPPTVVEPGSGGRGGGYAANPVLVSGQVRLTGELAEAQAPAGVFVSARAQGMRMPLLTRRWYVDDPHWRSEGGAKVLDYRLLASDTMPGMEPLSGGLPDIPLELKFHFTPHGMVDAAEGTEIAILPLDPASPEVSVTLEPGMPVPDEPPPAVPPLPPGGGR